MAKANKTCVRTRVELAEKGEECMNGTEKMFFHSTLMFVDLKFYIIFL